VSLKTGRLEERLRKNREGAKANGNQIFLLFGKAAILPIWEFTTQTCNAESSHQKDGNTLTYSLGSGT
jgi:hypothetical protein